MKVSTNWLKKYIDIDCPLHELADGLTMAGLEVEETNSLSKDDFKAAGGAGLEDDIVFDVKITPNRGDWLSMIGVAREAAPLLNKKVRLPEPKVCGKKPVTSELINIKVNDPDLCKRYMGIVVRNVVIKDSPEWMQDRLIAAGMRPINNVVDITNYVMLELGQPLHAFDYSLVKGHQIIARRAKAGETILTLDDVERKLEPDMLVIADSECALAVAGIMGGSYSEISKQTKDILIESANFNSVSIRRTSKRLGLVTESSYRFERSVDPSVVELAALRAVELICEYADGEAAEGKVDVYPDPVKPLNIKVRPNRVNAILGTSIEAKAMVEYLISLGIEAHIENDIIETVVPTFRPDITKEIDLIEEVGRVYGYDKLEMTLPNTALQGKDSKEGKFRAKIRRILMSCGIQEVLTHSIVDSKLADIAGKTAEKLIIRNPLSEELDSMRSMLIPNLLQVVARNQAYGTQDVSVFETGKVYYNKEGSIGEKLAVAGAMVGNLWKSAWSLPVKSLDVDFYLCKGVIESLLSGLGIVGTKYVKASETVLHPTRGAEILVNGKSLGFFGEVAPSIIESMDIRGRACIFELNFDALMSAAPVDISCKELPKYPALYRHITAVVSDKIKYENMEDVVRRSGKGLVEDVALLDVYKGEQIGDGNSSVTLSVVFRSLDKTLTDEEVNKVLADIKEALKNEVCASFR